MYDFDECKKRGDKGEMIVVAALRSRDDWLVERQTSARNEQGDLGLDYVVRHENHRCGLQIKADSTGYRTKRVPLEMEHVDRFGEARPGWLRRTTAGFVAVLHAPVEVLNAMPDADRLTPTQWRDWPDTFGGARLLVLRTDTMRENFDRWKAQRPLGPAENNERGSPRLAYVTWNVCVTIKELEVAGAVTAHFRVRFGWDRRSMEMGAVADKMPRQGGLFGA